MSSAPLSFYFDLGSPLAYLAAERVLHVLPGPAPWCPVLASELDRTNGFGCVQANVADVGSVAQLGCMLYLLGEPRQCDTPVLNPSALA